jgi:hypothetical protein
MRARASALSAAAGGLAAVPAEKRAAGGAGDAASSLRAWPPGGDAGVGEIA